MTVREMTGALGLIVAILVASLIARLPDEISPLVVALVANVIMLAGVARKIPASITFFAILSAFLGLVVARNGNGGVGLAVFIVILWATYRITRPGPRPMASDRIIRREAPRNRK
jgi:hypothetical protein